jgi:hypothetical protein
MISHPGDDLHELHFYTGVEMMPEISGEMT